MGNRSEIRQLVYGFVREIVDWDSTVIMTHELKASVNATNDERPFFICDGVERLDMLYSGGDYLRTLRIVKMRGANHVMRPVMFKISSEGITAFPDTRLPE